MSPGRRFCIACLALWAFSFGPATQAQSPWPTKPIRLIVPIAAGGVTDAIVRKASQAMSTRLGQPLIVDNRPGANGVVGGEACARAAPDGYTLCVLNTGITSVNPVIYDKHPFDPATAFAPIGNLYFLTGALVAANSLPIKSVNELLAFAQTQSNSINFGTIGPGSYPEVFLGWLNNHWKVDITGIPYKGGGPVSLALLAGEVQISAAALGNFIGQIQSGRITALAVSSSRRAKLLPNVPTYSEVGLGGFQGHLWWGLFAPAGTPPAIVSKLNAEFNQLFKELQFIEFLESHAAESAVGTTEAFAAFVKSDQEWTASVLKSIKNMPR